MVGRTTIFALIKFGYRLFFLSAPQRKPLFSHQIVKFSLLFCCWLACLGLLAACRPEADGDSDQQLTEATQQIALDFQANNNLDEARNRLGQLTVANPSQWLVYVAENAIVSDSEATATLALVNLATKLELQSADITRYATAHNLLAAPAPLPTPVPVALNLTTSSTATINTTTASQPLVAPVAQKAPLSTTVVLTLSAASSSTVGASSAALTTTAATTTTAAPAVATKPVVKAKDAINVRGGPGVNYDLVGVLQSGESAAVSGKNPEGDWWEIALTTGQSGWVYSQLVEPIGDVASVAVAANIPAPPPPTATAVAQVPAAPAAQAADPATPTSPPANPSDTPHFTLVAKRMWSKAENGDCRGQHLLRINVLDANGVRLNGVMLEGIYTGEKIVTGSQGKGDGVMEFDLYHSGEAFKVITNNDGRPATSDNADGFTTRSMDIDEATLIAGGYCSNHDDCQVFYSSFGCLGHHSWEATFKRNY